MPAPEPVSVDPVVSARAAGLRHVSDRSPGIRRRRSGKGWRYTLPDGSRLTDPAEIQRIAHLAIPPAYRDVWICADPRGHLQATGRDARGRKQYRYHPKWRQVRDATKYTRTMAFGEVLPKIRARVQHDLGLPGLPRDRVLATIVRLLDMTYIRVGNEEYAKENNSFGLTTMENRHVDVTGSAIHFRFRGKSGRENDIDVRDARVARIVRRCQELPGKTLFQYCGNDGEYHAVDSADVNGYLEEMAGADFTAKDFRTWAGTVLAAWALQEMGRFASEAQAKKHVVVAIEKVAQQLGNTPSVCRKCYVHPEVLNAHLDGSLVELLEAKAERTMSEELAGLTAEEGAVIALLRRRLAEASVAA